MSTSGLNEIAIAFESAEELRRSMPQSGRLLVDPRHVRGAAPAMEKGKLVVLVVGLGGDRYEIRTAAVPIRASAAGAPMEIELLPEESHVREMLDSYAAGAPMDWPERRGRRVRVRCAIEYEMAPGEWMPAETRDVGPGGVW